MADNPLNAVNRGVYISDNLPFLKELNDGCIDLVCIDPPFAKNETFGRKNEKAPDPLKPPLSDEERRIESGLLRRWGIHNPEQARAAGIDWPETRYHDIWSWEHDVHESWLEDIKANHSAVNALIEATRLVHGDGTAAYLCYMAVRLFEIRRVLKDTGSLYLHCDHTANAYLRQLLDGIFGNGENGKPGFRHEVVWQLPAAAGYKALANKFIRGHDTILHYSKGKKATFNKYYLPYGKEQLARFSKFDGDGRRYKPITKERRLYLDDAKGVPITDVWTDIASFQTVVNSPEITGYPTQKPIALAERIIRASCPEGGVVLDCFAGCAYVAVAAERLGRRWVACDINPRAWTVFRRQFEKPKLALLTCEEPVYDHQARQTSWGDQKAYVYGPDELPKDAVKGEAAVIPALRLPERKFKVQASVIPEREMLEILLRMSGYRAWCCGFANRKPDGIIVKTTRNFELDHLNPVSKEGTSHQITNRAPLCPDHNRRKSNQRLHLAEYREQIVADGELMVDDVSQLMNLAEAAQRTLDIYSSRQPQKRLDV